jgi:oligopeptide/dipeptide ABC transporter ATP-binding protein
VTAPVLRVEELRCGFDTEDGYLRVVDGISFELNEGETLGLVGESGCGKTVSALAVMGLLPKPAGIVESGRILYRDQDLAAADSRALKRVRGREISMIFQEPMTALNPVHRIGRQIVEALNIYEPDLRDDVRGKRAIELLEVVGIPAPEQRLREYPHQLSGGMRQRVMIAMALAGKPKVLIADEPTTALDVTVQAQILDLLRSLQAEYGMSMLFITHDLGVVAELCDDVIVMYAGRIAEHAAVRDLFRGPRHPYTRGLIRSIPTPETPSKSILPVIEGVVPQLTEMPDGCRFSSRCELADEICRRAVPPPADAAPGHQVACHHWQSVAS